MLSEFLSLLALTASALGHGDHDHQTPVSGPYKSLWYNTLPGDGGTQVLVSIQLLQTQLTFV